MLQSLFIPLSNTWNLYFSTDGTVSATISKAIMWSKKQTVKSLSLFSAATRKI